MEEFFLLNNKGILIYLFTINLIGFCLMWRDKRLSQKGEWRISEKTLITVALIGGALGSYAGMLTFRHKTKHVKFYIGIPCIIFLHIGLIVALKSELHIKIYEEFIKNINNSVK